MPEAKKSAKQAKKQEETSGSRYITAVIIIALIVVAIVVGYVLSSALDGGGAGGGQQSFQSFQSAFMSAQKVAIYATTGGNNTAINCALGLIETTAQHRPSNTIDFLVIANSTSCLTSNGALGKANGTMVVPIKTCLAISDSEPAVFVNYSETNSTVIKDNKLYTSGDVLFLSECGIASELG